MEVVNENSLGDLKLKAHSATEEAANSESVKCNGDVHGEEEMDCAETSPCNGDSKSIPPVDEPMDCSENGLELSTCEQEVDSLPEPPKSQDNHISAGEEDESEDPLIEEESRGEAEEDSLPDNCENSRTDSVADQEHPDDEADIELQEQPLQDEEGLEDEEDSEAAIEDISASEDPSSVNLLHSSENLEDLIQSSALPQDDEDEDKCAEDKEMEEEDKKEKECEIVDLLTPVKNQQDQDDDDDDDDDTDSRNETTPEKNSANKKKKTQPITNVTPRRSSRNINKTKSYVDETEVKSEDDDIQEVPEAKPVTTIQATIVKKNTIVVSDTKRLAEIAAGSKAAAAKGGKKEPTLVIIDTNSLLANKSGQVSLTPTIPSRVSVVPVSAAQSFLTAKAVKMPPAVSITPPPGVVAKQQQQLATARRELQSIPHQVLPPREPQVILPSLTDDMFVVEAPSFIVPYVYEKPPVNALKEFLKDLEKRVKEEQAERRKKEEEEEKRREEEERKRKEILAAQQPSPTSTQKDKEEIKMEVDETEEEEKKVDEKKEDEKKEDENKEDEKKDGEVKELGKKDGEVEELEKKDGEVKELEKKDGEVKELEKKDGEVKELEKKDGGVKELEKKDVMTKDEGKNEEEKMDVDEKEIKTEAKVEPVTKDGDTTVGDKAKMEVDVKDKSQDEVKNQAKDKDKNEAVKEKAAKKEETPTVTAPSDEKKAQASDVEVLEDKTNKTKSDNYFENPLGKFFMQIGINLVQEHVQTDLLKNQMRKKDKEGNKCSADVHMAISALTKTLEVSKENNKPFRFDLNKCQLCNFRTESQLVMAHHLETPHMKNFVYRCNFCELEVRSPHDILFHMEAEHNVRGRLDRSPAFHQCPNCPFEDNQKGKLSRHLLSCAKKYKPERNQEPPLGWEPPAKIPRVRGARGLPLYPSPNAASLSSAARLAAVPGVVSPLSRLTASQAALAAQRGRGRPPMYVQRYPTSASSGQKLSPHIRQGAGVVFRPNNQGPVLLPTSPYSMTPSLIQVKQAKAVSNGATAKILQQPSISITPLPRSSATGVPPVGGSSSPSGGAASGQPKPGRPPTSATPAKNSFVICEICDGYIKDLEQLRNHMQWIHKVKIHPKMIYNRPPLNCQKCQFRFFTDQGLERHLLGSHGLVTSSMQEAANKGKDGGRCPVCGRVYQWKLLNHVARDHSMSLKPAHLSYKCTVCTATFGMYKQFENHVYSAHSVVAKRVIDKPKAAAASSLPAHQPSTSANSGEAILKPLKINDEITIIPQPARVKQGVKPAGGATVTPTPVASKPPASK